jgi:hypothetical protein
MKLLNKIFSHKCECGKSKPSNRKLYDNFTGVSSENFKYVSNDVLNAWDIECNRHIEYVEILKKHLIESKDDYYSSKYRVHISPLGFLSSGLGKFLDENYNEFIAKINTIDNKSYGDIKYITSINFTDILNNDN